MSYLLIVVAVTLIVVHLYCTRNDIVEHLRNVASICNRDEMTVTNFNVNGAFNLLPIGTIIALWTDTIPDGWALCDGTNGTPDLRGRTIIGAGQGKGLTNRAFKSTGGTETHTLSIAEMPKHNHNMSINKYHDNNPGNRHHRDYALWGSATGSSYKGGSRPHNNMQPFVSLNWIMRIR